MISEPSSQVESRPSGFQADRGIERRLVAASWQNAVELARAADSFGLGFDDFLDQLCGVAVGYLRQCAENDQQASWNSAATYLRRFGVAHIHDLYCVLVDTPVPESDSIPDLVQQVQRAADARADDDCRYATRQVTLLVLHALSCPHCRRCAAFGTDARRPSIARRGKPKRKAAVTCG